MVNTLPLAILPIRQPVHQIVISQRNVKQEYQKEIKHAVALGFHHYYDLPDNIRWELLRLLVSTRQNFDFVACIEQSLKKQSQPTQEDLC